MEPGRDPPLGRAPPARYPGEVTLAKPALRGVSHQAAFFVPVALAVLLGLKADGAAGTSGAIVYARRRPDPFPAIFGYHEIFHALVIAAVALQYAVVAFFVLPLGS